MKKVLIIVNRSFGVIQSVVIVLFIAGLIRSLLWDLEFYENNDYQYKLTLIGHLIPLGILGIFLISSLVGVIKKRPLLIYFPTLLIIILRIVKFWYPVDPPQ